MTKSKFETPNLIAENMAKLAELFPGVVAEGKVNLDLLRSYVGDEVFGDEAYEFTWVGKRDAIAEAGRPIRKTLRPFLEESKDWATTGNLYIEGDNLDVLKLLQESYLGKVKMIYIDPPYNTGNDFVYRDNFTTDKGEYDEEAGAYGEDGDRLFRNTETNGRFHSDWCSMMYPRLVLARNVLAPDGIIFISIDDGELIQLRKLCDEAFGAANFVAQIVWQKVYSPRMDVDGFSRSHDYILCYVKSSIESVKRESFQQNEAQFSYTDNATGKKYRRRSVRKEGSHSTRSERPNLFFPLVAPDGTQIYPMKPDGTEGCWRWSMNTYNENLALNLVEWVNTAHGWQVYAKQFADESASKPPETLWFHNEVSHNHNAAEDVKKILGGKFFDSPKPKELIAKMLKISTDENAIVLDFFSGSATTAHAVMQLNAEDGGQRKFIMVQLPEVCAEGTEAAKAGYKNICEIGKERIRRAGEKIKTEMGLAVQNLDIGFRVLKLADSNMNEVYFTASETTQDVLFDMVHNVKPDRTDMDLLFACLLDWGLPLSMPHSQEKIEDFTVHTYNGGDLIACFDAHISESAIREIAKRQPLRAVFRDSGFTSSPQKINVFEIFKLLAPHTNVRVI